MDDKRVFNGLSPDIGELASPDPELAKQAAQEETCITGTNEKTLPKHAVFVWINGVLETRSFGIKTCELIPEAGGNNKISSVIINGQIREFQPDSGCRVSDANIRTGDTIYVHKNYSKDTIVAELFHYPTPKEDPPLEKVFFWSRPNAKIYDMPCRMDLTVAAAKTALGTLLGVDPGQLSILTTNDNSAIIMRGEELIEPVARLNKDVPMRVCIYDSKEPRPPQARLS